MQTLRKNYQTLMAMQRDLYETLSQSAPERIMDLSRYIETLEAPCSPLSERDAYEFGRRTAAETQTLGQAAVKAYAFVCSDTQLVDLIEKREKLFCQLAAVTGFGAPLSKFTELYRNLNQPDPFDSAFMRGFLDAKGWDNTNDLAISDNWEVFTSEVQSEAIQWLNKNSPEYSEWTLECVELDATLRDNLKDAALEDYIHYKNDCDDWFQHIEEHCWVIGFATASGQYAGMSATDIEEMEPHKLHRLELLETPNKKRRQRSAADLYKHLPPEMAETLASQEEAMHNASYLRQAAIYLVGFQYGMSLLKRYFPDYQENISLFWEIMKWTKKYVGCVENKP